MLRASNTPLRLSCDPYRPDNDAGRDLLREGLNEMQKNAEPSPSLRAAQRSLATASDAQKLLDGMEELRSHRLKGVYDEVKDWGAQPIRFDADPRGTQLYSIEETKRSYCRRFIDLADSASQLLGEGHVVSAAILARSQIETVAMATFFVHELSRMTCQGDLAAFEKRVAQFIGGPHSDATSPKRVHVMDAMRHLEGLDQAYVDHLFTKFSATRAKLEGLVDLQSTGLGLQDLVGKISAMKHYDTLSEFAHTQCPRNVLYLRTA